MIYMTKNLITTNDNNEGEECFDNYNSEDNFNFNKKVYGLVGMD